MFKQIFLLTIGACLCASTYANSPINVSEMNSLEEVDLNYIRTHPLLFTIKSRTSDSVILHTPSIGNQGTLNSCVGWALCYAGASIRLYNDYGTWTDALCSPSYLFNQYKGTVASVDITNCDSVSSNILHLGIKLMQEGTCTLAKMPYTTNCNLQPTLAQKIDALNKRFTVNQLPALSLNDTSFYKIALRSGWPIVVGMPLYDSFDSMWNDPSAHGVWSSVDTTDYDHNAPGHASCIVGYDDTRDAFKVMNSWGTSGGDGGFYWVKYNLVQQGVYRDALFIIKRDSLRINGSNDFCGPEECYSVANAPAGCQYSWSVNSNYFPGDIISSGQGTSCVCIQANGLTPAKGDDRLLPGLPRSVLSVTISDPNNSNNTYSTSKSIYNPSPKPAISASDSTPTWKAGQSRSFTMIINNSITYSNLRWIVKKTVGNTVTRDTTYGRYLTYTPTLPSGSSNAIVEITATNLLRQCQDNSIQKTYLIYKKIGPKVSVEQGHISVDISEENLSTEEHTSGNRNYTLELWNSIYGLMRTQPVQTTNEQIDICGLPQGVYILLLKENNTIIEQTKVIIQ